MKIIRGILVASAFSLGLGVSAVSATTVIDFEDVGGGVGIANATDVSTHYSGVTFTDPFTPSGVVAAAGAFTSNTFFARQGGNSQPNGDADDLKISFSAPVTSFSMDIFRNQGFFFSYQVFGTSGLLTSGSTGVNSLPTGQNPYDFNYSNATEITYLLLTTHSGINPGFFGGFRIDDLTFSGPTVGAVPEPSTWAMLLIGFAGMAYAARRRGQRTWSSFRSAAATA